MRRAGIKPMSDGRRAELAAAGIAHPSSTFAPKPANRNGTRPAQSGPGQATVDAVLQRDGHSCVVCGGALHGCRCVDWSIHHRLRRSQGGDSRLSNLISTCGHGTAGCHGLIHGGPDAARKAGWLLRRGQDPEQMLVAHAMHGHVFLLNTGQWQSRRPVQGNDSGSERCVCRPSGHDMDGDGPADFDPSGCPLHRQPEPPANLVHTDPEELF